ncbi:prepilin peptidase [Pontimonas sp.]|uniref:prepilin peptidase n=1 Tax=Pontimonas sp. TaxID=2304492 RepID=UPI0028709615|nr:prepilin peptidase [Pontimonas sp.]MDR9396160.1 prepilin peptidase [Pontimonas sp.]MDR9434549.1 prepilin peptidase [Pontimonas sp.]
MVSFDLAHALLVPVLFRLVWWDQRSHRLPDALTLTSLGLSAAALLFLAVYADWGERAQSAGLAVAVSVLGLWLLSEAPGHPLGFGDVKLGALLALHLGVYHWSVVALWWGGAFIVGGLHATWLLWRGRLGPRDAVAFGPYLAGTWLAVLAGVGGAHGA